MVKLENALLSPEQEKIPQKNGVVLHKELVNCKCNSAKTNARIYDSRRCANTRGKRS
jgi:hypothetical protein